MTDPRGNVRRRSTNICNTCRQRKVRCDGQPGTCGNCRRLSLPCSFHAAGSGTSSDIPSLRVQHACNACRLRKARCDAELPTCRRCRNRGLQCAYDRRPSRPSNAMSDSNATSIQSASPETGVVPDVSVTDSAIISSPTLIERGPPARVAAEQSPGTQLPKEDVMMHILNNFFQHIYPIPVFSFIHKASLLHRYTSQSRDESLLLALIGITTQLCDLGEEMRVYGAACTDAAEKSVMGDYERPTMVKVQTLILVIVHRIVSERFNAAFTLMSIASRFAYALQLNFENPGLSFLVRESRRRLMWSLFLLDAGLASGLRYFTLCPAESIHLQLPCREKNFELCISRDTEPLQSSQGPCETLGLVAFSIRLSWIRTRILGATRRLLLDTSANPRTIAKEVLGLGRELEQFAADLPPGYELSDTNLQLWAYSQRMVPYFLLHIWWRQCHCDLYRIGLEGLREALPQDRIALLDPVFIATCQQQCFEKASSMIDVFRILLPLRTNTFLDINLPVCAYQCARLLFHTYRTNAARFGITAEDVLNRARLCADVVDSSTISDNYLRIREDLQKLIERGISRPSSPSPPRSPLAVRSHISMSQNSPAPAQQILSRHSIIGRVNVGAAESVPAATLPHDSIPTPSSTIQSATSPSLVTDPPRPPEPVQAECQGALYPGAVVPQSFHMDDTFDNTLETSLVMYPVDPLMWPYQDLPNDFQGFDWCHGPRLP